MTPVTAGGRTIGGKAPVFVIAEAGVNHNGSAALALRLVDAAARAGADAVKFQTFKADRLAAAAAPTARYQRAGAGGEESQRKMLAKLELSDAAHRAVAARCKKRKILFLSTPFDQASVDFLDTLGVPAFKTSSGDLTDLPLLSHIAAKGKPMIVSTGMSTLAEVRDAVRAVRRAGNRRLVLLHCVSVYPAAPKDVNLKALETLARAFDVPVGYSDHTTGLAASLAAVARGARVIEKHFTLDRGLPGPDHRMSLDPASLAALVRGVRDVEAALGDGVKKPVAAEMETRRVARKSLAAARDLAAGERLDRAAVTALRPGTGLSPTLLPRLVGRRLRRAVPAGTLLKREWLR
jgi:N-acetylneuraminate synthase